MLSFWATNNTQVSIRPTHGFWGFSAHPVNQGLYNYQDKFVFADQIAFTQSVGGNSIRVDMSTNSTGTIPNTGPNYQWGRLFGTNPQSVGYAANSTDVRRNNYGLWQKYQDLGINVIPMIAVRSRDSGTDEHWVVKYANTTEAYNAGFAQGAGFATEYAPFFPYMELGNEIELFTDIQTGGSGLNPGDYDTAKLVLAVAYVQGMEEGIKSVAPETITMFGSAGWAHFYIIDQVFAAAPTINKVVLHHYSEHQAAIKNGTFPGYSTYRNIWDVYASRYPDKGVWCTEMGYRWSNSYSYEENEQRAVTNFISIVNDYNVSENAEAIYLHEMMELRTRVDNTGDQWYGQIGYPDYANTGISNPYKKLLGRRLEV